MDYKRYAIKTGNKIIDNPRLDFSKKLRSLVRENDTEGVATLFAIADQLELPVTWNFDKRLYSKITNDSTTTMQEAALNNNREIIEIIVTHMSYQELLNAYLSIKHNAHIFSRINEQTNHFLYELLISRPEYEKKGEGVQQYGIQMSSTWA